MATMCSECRYCFKNEKYKSCRDVVTPSYFCVYKTKRGKYMGSVKDVEEYLFEPGDIPLWCPRSDNKERIAEERTRQREEKETVRSLKKLLVKTAKDEGYSNYEIAKALSKPESYVLALVKEMEAE